VLISFLILIKGSLFNKVFSFIKIARSTTQNNTQFVVPKRNKKALLREQGFFKVD
jgi:hypothetical protein